MSEQEGIYPTATKEFWRATRDSGAKNCRGIQGVYSERIRRRGRLRENQAANRCGSCARDSMSVLHPRAYKVRFAKRSNSRGDHGGHLGSCRNAGRGSLCPFNTRA
jgi:hypothetical protein